MILLEECEAKFSSLGFPAAGAGACANGLGFPALVTEAPIYGGETVINYRRSGISDGKRYTKRRGGEEIVVTCTPSASSTINTLGSAVSVVYYTSAILVPKINLAGLTRASDGYKLLTGQQITGAIVGGPPVKANSHKWDISGGDPFKDYVATQSKGERKELLADDKNDPSFSFFTNQMGASKVNCDVEFEFPSGAKVEGGLPTMSLTALPISSVRPLFGDWKVVNGQVRYDNPNNPTAFAFAGTPNVTSDGQNWEDAEIIIPAPFGQVGSGCFVQLITPNRTMVRSVTGNYPTTFYKAPPNGVEALDAGFPYPFEPSWPVSRAGKGYDTPIQPLNYNPNDGGGSYWTSVSASDTFRTWLMYKPPAVGTQRAVWIPIAMYTWKWSGTAVRASDGSWEPLVIGLSGFDAPQSLNNEFPLWNRFSPGNFNFVPGP